MSADGRPEMSETITVAWWNTSLAPSGNSRGCEDLKRNAAEVIAYLLISSEVDFIALGEISTEDFDYLQSIEAFKDLKFLSGVSKAGRSKFDICYIYNPNKIAILNTENITSVRGNSTLKIAQKINILELQNKTIFTIFASHWPSRLWCEENNADRHVLGIRLRDEVDKVINQSPAPPHIILLGDYNDEPFDKSLSHHLMATRDIELVQKRQHLFYNPYWGHMGQGKNDTPQKGGSYYYKSGEVTRWHTFDQIIYSHAFVSAKTWKLSQKQPYISNVPGLIELVISAASDFDHIPVCGTIEKVV